MRKLNSIKGRQSSLFHSQWQSPQLWSKHAIQSKPIPRSTRQPSFPNPPPDPKGWRNHQHIFDTFLSIRTAIKNAGGYHSFALAYFGSEKKYRYWLDEVYEFTEQRIKQSSSKRDKSNWTRQQATVHAFKAEAAKYRGAAFWWGARNRMRDASRTLEKSFTLDPNNPLVYADAINSYYTFRRSMKGMSILEHWILPGRDSSKDYLKKFMKRLMDMREPRFGGSDWLDYGYALLMMRWATVHAKTEFPGDLDTWDWQQRFAEQQIAKVYAGRPNVLKQAQETVRLRMLIKDFDTARDVKVPK